MDFTFMAEYWRLFLKGAEITILLSVCTVLLGTVLGIVIALMKLSRIWPLRWFANAYIEFLRGTPLLVQLFIIFFGLPHLGINLPDMLAGIIALSINSAAYIAEIIRAGIQAVDKGQTEASRSLGMTGGMSMRHIILPQAFKNILPALGNEFIVVIKESSIVMTIGITDLMFNADTVRGITFQPFEPLIVAAFIYFVLTFTLSKTLGIAERRMRTSD